MSQLTILGDIQNMCKYFHKPKVSENTSVGVKCHPQWYNECNNGFRTLKFFQNSKTVVLQSLVIQK